MRELLLFFPHLIRNSSVLASICFCFLCLRLPDAWCYRHCLDECFNRLLGYKSESKKYWFCVEKLEGLLFLPFDSNDVHTECAFAEKGYTSNSFGRKNHPTEYIHSTIPVLPHSISSITYIIPKWCYSICQGSRCKITFFTCKSLTVNIPIFFRSKANIPNDCLIVRLCDDNDPQ